MMCNNPEGVRMCVCLSLHWESKLTWRRQMCNIYMLPTYTHSWGHCPVVCMCVLVCVCVGSQTGCCFLMFSEVNTAVQLLKGKCESDCRLLLSIPSFIPPSLSRARDGDRGEEEVSLYYHCVSVQDGEKSSSTKPGRKDVSVHFCYIIPAHTLKLHLNKSCRYYWVLWSYFLRKNICRPALTNIKLPYQPYLFKLRYKSFNFRRTNA